MVYAAIQAPVAKANIMALGFFAMPHWDTHYGNSTIIPIDFHLDKACVLRDSDARLLEIQTIDYLTAEGIDGRLLILQRTE
jgi:hypothetical protein